MHLFKFFISLLISCAIANPALAQNLVIADELVVVVPAKFPPYYSTNENGQPVGFAIDVFDEVAARAGLRYRYEVKRSWKDTIFALKLGNADIIPNIGITQERSQFIDFTSPSITFPITLFLRQSNLEINSDKDLPGRKVAVVAENSALSEMKKRQNVKVDVFSDIDIAFFALISGQVDALAYPEPVMMHIAREFQLTDKIRSLSPPLIEIKRAIGVGKGATELLQKLELSMQALLSSDQYNQIYTKWFTNKVPFWDVTKVFWSMTGLVVILVIIFAVFRHRELLALNTSLQKQIDEATKQLSDSNQYLKDLTVTDALTGISNRRAFENSLQSLMNQASRYHDGFSMLLFDIDDFKQLNDRFGHDMGDRVLKDLVERIDEIVRDVDVLSRWGGEEFTILMPQTNHTGALKMAERCRRVVADALFDEVGQVTISLGVTCFSKNDTERKFFKRADDALYQAKSEGKNRVVWIGEKC